MSFFVHRLQPGDVLKTSTQDEEAAFVILGDCYRRLGSRARISGKTKECFRWASLHAVYPCATASFVQRAERVRNCRMPCALEGKPTGAQAYYSSGSVEGLRGGGNVSRQIVDVLSPHFRLTSLW